jgi:hypothetical protein
MYNTSSNIDLYYVIAGILSAILIITFFIMALRLRKIMESVGIMSAIARAVSRKEGILEIECPNCERINFIFDKDKPVCRKCSQDLTKQIALAQKDKQSK